MLLATYSFATFAAGFAILAGSLCFRNQPASATIAGAMAVVAVLLAYFPDLTSLDALTIHVKMRDNLRESQEITSSIKSLAIRSAEFALYSTLNQQPLFPAREQMPVPLTKEQIKLTNGMLDEVKKLHLDQEQIELVTDPSLGYVDGRMMNAYRFYFANKLEAVKDPEARQLEQRLYDAQPDFADIAPGQRREMLEKTFAKFKTIKPTFVDEKLEERILMIHDDLARLHLSEYLKDFLQP